MFWICFLIFSTIFFYEIVLNRELNKALRVTEISSLIIFMVLICISLKPILIKDNIELYNNANHEIEETIKQEVEVFLSATDEKLNIDKNADGAFETIINKYPKFASSELVNKQITNHIENTQKINELKVKLDKYQTFWKTVYFNGNIFLIDE